MVMKFTNNATTTLASNITSSATSLTVSASTGSLFPTLGGSDYFYCTLANTNGAIEIVKVTARSTDTFTITRGQDGTSGQAWNSGDKVELRLVAASLNDIPKLDEANTFSGANAYGTPASITLTNATGLSLTAGVTGTLPVANGGTGVTTSTGSGANVLGTSPTITSPTLVTPVLGTPASGTLTNCTGLPTSGLTGTISEANGGTGTTTGYYGFKNRIINGAMVIDQRNAGASVTPTSTQYTLDRWQANLTVASKYSLQQNAGSVTPPTGFTNYLGVTSLSSYSVGASDQFNVLTKIEGYNTADLAWGTASASAITLSFRVYSSLTGTFSGSITNSATNRCYVFNYTVSSANTWTNISVTIAGDTSGTWVTNNGIGMFVIFGLGSGSTYSGTAGSWGSTYYTQSTGSVSVVGTNGATFYITGVQLEKGSTATSFDYRPYGTELNLCYRYFWKSNPENAGKSGCINGSFNGTTVWSGFVQFPVSMRAQPTITRGGTNDNFYAPNVSATLTGNVVGWTYSTISAFTEFNSASPAAAGAGYYASYNGQVSVTAEL